MKMNQIKEIQREHKEMKRFTHRQRSSSIRLVEMVAVSKWGLLRDLGMIV
jgi:hypothetical protein